METAKINPSEYKVNVREWPVEAAESRLFEGKDATGAKVALKVYPTLSLSQVRYYAGVTNLLARKVNSSEMSVSLEIGGQKQDYALHIVPVTRVGTVEDPDKKGTFWPCAISPFIEGPSLFDLDKNFQSRHGGASPRNPLFLLSQSLEELVGRKVSLIPWNVKPKEVEGKRILEITDISGSVKSI